MPRNAKKYKKMPRNQKGSTPRKGSVQVQVFSRPRSTMTQSQTLPQAMGPLRSDAGVGIGMLMGDLLTFGYLMLDDSLD